MSTRIDELINGRKNEPAQSWALSLLRNRHTDILNALFEETSSLAGRIKADHGTSDCMEILRGCSLEILFQPCDTLPYHPYLGQYAYGKIILAEDVLERVRAYLAEHHPDCCTPDVLQVTAAHELYHHLFETEDLPVAKGRHPDRILGLIPVNRPLPALGEIGARYFSVCMTGACFSPVIYEILLDHLSEL